MRTPVAAAATAVTLAIVLAGCAAPTGGAGDDRLLVVASIDVYGQIAEDVGGDAVEVTSIITSSSQDPHFFQPSARDQLAVSRADIVVDNGGGYDAFIDAMITSSGSRAPVVTASELSHDRPQKAADAAGSRGEGDPERGDHAESDHPEDGDHGRIEGFNEHVWYDPHTMALLAEEIAAQLGEMLPAAAHTFRANGQQFAAGAARLESGLRDIAAAHGGSQVFITEPAPAHLVAAAGLENVTPDAFGQAVEEGQDVPPATLLEALRLLHSGDVRVVVSNAQTGGAETMRIEAEAEAGGIPVIRFSETLPDGQTYIRWMQGNVEALAVALSS